MITETDDGGEVVQRKGRPAEYRASKLIDVTFVNVTLTIGQADSAGQAYDTLCTLLHPLIEAGCEYTTDQYYTDENGNARDTSELFPR